MPIAALRTEPRVDPGPALPFAPPPDAPSALRDPSSARSEGLAEAARTHAPRDVPRPSHAIEETISLCPTCRSVVPAVLHEQDGHVRMWRACPTHGTRDDLYWKNAALFRQLDALLPKDKGCELPDCAVGVRCERHYDWTYTVMVNVTGRCNFHCPVCLAGANEIDTGTISPAQLHDVLPLPAPGAFRPNVCLIGGEPTVRKDLPELVRAVRDRGYVPRLNTNGALLTDERRLRALRAAGLEWVILQFDGFEDSIYEKTRGQGLIAQKLEVIEKLKAHGFKVQFAVMMVDGLNTNQIGRIVRFALANGIFWVSFYPHSRIARNDAIDGGGDETFVSDLLDAIERETDGRIRPQDFVDSVRWLGRAYRITKREEFRQKLSTLPLVVAGTPDDYAPITRFASPRGWRRAIPTAARLAPTLGSVLGYQTQRPPEGLLFLTVEKFHNVDTIDLREASSCHMCYVTRNGTVAFDIYNALHREHGDW